MVKRLFERDDVSAEDAHNMLQDFGELLPNDMRSEIFRVVIQRCREFKDDPLVSKMDRLKASTILHLIEEEGVIDAPERLEQ